MAERPESPDDNPFRAYSARNVLARARERLQLVRHWLIRHDGKEMDYIKPSPDHRKVPGEESGE